MAVRQSDIQTIVGTIRNQFGTAEGSLLPPPQKGQWRVPFVTNLRVAQTQSFVGGTQFTLTFLEPETFKPLIDHYNIYVGGLTGNINQLNGPNTCASSPAVVRVNTIVAEQVVFYVQTVLKNGLVSDLSSSPRCTGQTIAGSINTNDIPNGSITLAQLANETAGSLISFNSSGVPILINPVASGSLLASNGTATNPVYETFGALNLVLGNTNLTTVDSIIYVSSAGTVTQLAPGTAGQMLITNGTGVAPSWSNPYMLLYNTTADATVANTLTETSIVATGVGSMTLPANFFSIGRSIRIRAYGYHSVAASPTIDIKIKYGSVILLDTGAIATHASTNQGVYLDAFITCRTTGATGTVSAQGIYNEEGFGSFPMTNTTTVTIDTTTSHLIDVTVTWNTASPSDTITISNLYLASEN